MKELSEADQTLCVAYVDGLLSDEAKLAFELRMTREPELAAALQRVLSTDLLVRRLSAKEGVNVARARRLRPFVWIASLAAAAVFLAWFALQLTSKPAATRFEVAVAPGFESALEYIDSVPELKGLRPPGLDVLRGENAASNVDLNSFLERAGIAGERLTKDSLSGDISEVRAGFFVVPVDTGSTRARVTIDAYPRVGAPVRLFPGSGDSGEVTGRCTLPSSRFARGSESPNSLRYQRGFLVPLGCEELDVVVSIVATDSGTSDRPALESSADAMQARMRAAGWSVRRLRVLEPKD